MQSILVKKSLRSSEKFRGLLNYSKWLLNKDKYESVFFYTFHKCASSLFSGYVLRNTEGLRNIDYASRLYQGREPKSIKFEKYGYIYGPIRLSADPSSIVYQQLVQPLLDKDLMKDKKIIFMIRDPRDILVSKYYSDGFSHGLSPSWEIRQRQLNRREKVKNMTVDEYVLELAQNIKWGFDKMHELYQSCPKNKILKYEDMIYRWNLFAEDFTEVVSVKKKILTQIYNKSRPSKSDNKWSHLRSGIARDFERKLKKDTVRYLNEYLKPVLETFDYDV